MRACEGPRVTKCSGKRWDEDTASETRDRRPGAPGRSKPRTGMQLKAVGPARPWASGPRGLSSTHPALVPGFGCGFVKFWVWPPHQSSPGAREGPPHSALQPPHQVPFATLRPPNEGSCHTPSWAHHSFLRVPSAPRERLHPQPGIAGTASAPEPPLLSLPPPCALHATHPEPGSTEAELAKASEPLPRL